VRKAVKSATAMLQASSSFQSSSRKVKVPTIKQNI